MSVSIGVPLLVIDAGAIKLSILSDIDVITRHDIQTIKSIRNKRFFAFA